MDDTYRGGSAPTIEDSQSQVFDDRQVQSAGLKITQQHNGHHLLPQGVTLPATIPEYENHFPGATHEPCISTAPAALGGYTRSLHLDVDSEDYSTTPQSFELGMDEYQAQQVFIRMQRRPRSQPADKTPTGGGFSSHRQLLDLAGLRDVIRQVILEEVPNGLSALQSDVLDLHADMQSMQSFVINTSKREAAAKGMISGMEQKLEEHWEGWKQRISELRNAILEHPNVDSSALGVFDRDALEDAIESSRMATIVGQEAKAEGTRMAKIMSDLEKRMESCEGKVSQARGPDAETQALTSRLKRDIEALMEMNDNTRDANQKLEAQLIDVQQTNLFLRTEVEDLKERLVASEDQSSMAKTTLEERHQKLHASMEMLEAKLEESDATYNSTSTNLMDEIKEIKQEVSESHRLAAVVGPHTMEVLRGELEGLSAKVDQVQASVPSALAPVQERIKHLQDSITQMQTSKLDAAEAVNQAMLEKSVARAVDTADRKINLVMSAISSIEERMESLTNTKADLGVVALKSELDSSITDSRVFMDERLQKLHAQVQDGLSKKLDIPELGASEKKIGQRITQLEGAILRGLKAVSDRVAAALLEKADAVELNDFRMQMRGILSEVDLRLRELSPTARLMASGPNARGTRCISCDQQVQTAKDAIHVNANVYGITGNLPADEKVFPSKLPAMKQWHNSYPQVQEAEPRGAATNAKAVQNRTQRETIINAPPAMTDDLAENIRGMAALSPFPPLSTSISYSPKAESISGNLKRSVLPQSPTRLAAQPKPKPRTTVGQPGLEVNGFAN